MHEPQMTARIDAGRQGNFCLSTVLPSNVTLSPDRCIAGLGKTVTLFGASRDHRIVISHILRVATLQHCYIAALQPSGCCIAAVGITESLHRCVTAIALLHCHS
jgi:hypothetical protein